MSVIKQVVGIDIAKDSLSIRFGTISDQQEERFLGSATFPNEKRGFHKLLSWARKQIVSPEAPLWFVMEATGAYYEHLAYFLSEHDQQLTVLLPNKVKHFIKTLEGKSKTDRLDARSICQFGLERPLSLWQAPTPQMKLLKELAREYNTVQEMATQVKNQLHAKDYTYEPSPETTKRLRAQVRLFQNQLRSIEQQLRTLVNDDDNLRTRIANITSAKGIGFMTVVTAVAETNGFALITSEKQITSYAGLDIAVRESGKQQGKPALSKKGNKHLRRAVFMPALAACRFNPVLKAFYLRLVRTKVNKKVAILAVARKILCLIYTLWKKNVPYDPNYRHQNIQSVPNKLSLQIA
jgi:transposase